MDKTEFRSYIKVRALLGITSTEIYKELQLACPSQAPQFTCVCKWAKLFRDGRESIEDDPRSGRPITAHTPNNVELVRRIVEEDRHSTYAQIEALTGLSSHTINEILHQSLKIRKLASRWIPHLLTDANRRQRLDACRHNLAMFKEGKWRICDVVTGDESWI
jgi:histone-lysine N-methyltransferase SETMAR